MYLNIYPTDFSFQFNAVGFRADYRKEWCALYSDQFHVFLNRLASTKAIPQTTSPFPDPEHHRWPV